MVAQIDRKVGGRLSVTWLNAGAGALALYSLVLAVLVLLIYQESHSVNVPLVVLSVAGLVIAVAMVATRLWWLAWVAAAMAVIDLVSDAPHQIPEIVHPAGAGRAVGAAAVLLVGVAVLAITVRAALLGRRAAGRSSRPVP
ncbi:MAG: hypothetical protein JF888_14360 [Candidatus Dormibacteraeota bacterium]|uniref:Uncharacterized protein n=1 Tax=Candidatus Dormiibacter inghamiae TaxID=3127013 RepID=A0A934KBW6_9BACT|nr:hypothetical protein [Candidatus Dormibacteraeota bacterium]MBJ7604804.1 hypothetical protein [Candidatus Dormibacteraeota bacterium]